MKGGTLLKSHRIKVAIIGAGISGLLCACELERLRPYSVVLEKEPEVGGHVRSFVEKGYTYDVGLHLFLGGYSYLIPFLKKAAVRMRYIGEGAVFYHEKKFYRLERKISSILKFRLLDFTDRVKILTTANRILKSDIDYFMRYDEEDFASWCEKNLSRKVLENFYAPVVKSVTFLSPEQVSSGLWLQAEKIRIQERENLAVYYPERDVETGGLSVVSKALKWYCERMGSEVWTNNEVKKIVIEDEKVKGIEYIHEGVEDFLEVPFTVFTGPIINLLNLVSEKHFPRDFRERIKNFKYTHVIAIQIGLDRSITDHRVAILMPNKLVTVAAQILPPYGIVAPPGKSLLAGTCITPSILNKTDDEIMDILIEDLKDPFPEIEDHILWTKVLKIKNAIEAQSPGIMSLKLDTNRTPVEGLYLAGNYANNDNWHSTIEGAARSGHNCAKLIEQDAEVLLTR